MPPPTTPSEAFATKLLGTAAVTAFVGTRIAPSLPKQDPVWPYIVYYKTAGGDGIRLSGRNILQNYTIRMDIYAQTEAEGEAILNAVNVAFDGWVDVPNKVKGCLPIGDADQQVTEDGSYISGQTFSLWFLTA